MLDCHVISRVYVNLLGFAIFVTNILLEKFFSTTLNIVIGGSVRTHKNLVESVLAIVPREKLKVTIHNCKLQ